MATIPETISANENDSHTRSMDLVLLEETHFEFPGPIASQTNHSHAPQLYGLAPVRGADFSGYIDNSLLDIEMECCGCND